MGVPIGVPGGAGRGRVQGGGLVFLWTMREKGKEVGRVGGGVGTGKGTGKSMRTRLSKLPFSKLPLSLSPNFGQKNPRAHKTKIGTPPPKRGIYGHEGFPAERTQIF